MAKMSKSTTYIQRHLDSLSWLLLLKIKSIFCGFSEMKPFLTVEARVLLMGLFEHKELFKESVIIS